MRFDERLARAVLLASGALGACVGTTAKDTTPHTGLEDLCDGATPPQDYVVALGYVTVEPGTPCPDPATAQLDVNGCTFLEWQHVTCGFDRVALDQVLVNDGYGGRFADASAAEDTGILIGPVDVCYYQGVFYLPPEHPVCGRPLRSDHGLPLVAGVRAGDAWADGPIPIVVGLARAERLALGAFWLRSAALEHASVASFARASADLIRFGAPPDLLADAHQAAIDEVGHARLCFALAGAYGGGPVAPAPLDGPWPTPPATRADLAASVVREGCVGETLAALDAAARLAGATDPAVREVLTRIVREESAHAALAWRTLAWLLRPGPDGAAGGREVRDRVAAVLAEERAKLDLPPGPAPTAREIAHGLVPPEVRARALRRGWEDVIAAAWSELAGDGSAAET